MVCFYNPGTWEGEAGGTAIQDQLWLHNKFKASMGYLGLYETLSQIKQDEKDRRRRRISKEEEEITTTWPKYFSQ